MPPKRKVTRKYEASRRNGHYNTTPATDRTKYLHDKISDIANVRLCKARRKLNFGRKPPRSRSADIPTNVQERKSPEKKSDIEASPLKVSSDESSPRRNAHGSRRPRINRELRDLLMSVGCEILPVRLRSEYKRYRTATGDRPSSPMYDHRLSSSPESTDLSLVSNDHFQWSLNLSDSRNV